MKTQTNIKTIFKLSTPNGELRTDTLHSEIREFLRIMKNSGHSELPKSWDSQDPEDEILHIKSEWNAVFVLMNSKPGSNYILEIPVKWVNLSTEEIIQDLLTPETSEI